MALIATPVTCGILSDEQLCKAFSAERRSIDILSTDFDSSTEGSVGGDSSLWDSSDRDDIDITGDESDDNSTQFCGSLSEYNGERAADGDDPMQAVSTESTDSGTEGDDERPSSWYKLRSRSKKQCKPPVKCAQYNDPSDEDDKMMPSEGSLPSQPPVKCGRGQGSRGRGGGRAGCGSQGRGRGYEGRGHGVRGRGRGMRGRGVYGRGRCCRGDGASGRSKKAGSSGLPTGATPISTPDSKHKDSDGFALCVMMVRTFQLELKLVHLNCLSSFSMTALWTGSVLPP